MDRAILARRTRWLGRGGLRTAARRVVAAAFALTMVSAVVAACSDASMGAVQVTATMEGEPSEPFGVTEFQVRLRGADGSVRDQTIPWPGGAGAAIPVPAGIYRAEISTVDYSDASECQPDPAAPGGQRCTRDKTTVRACDIEFEIESGIVRITYRTGADDHACVIEGPNLS